MRERGHEMLRLALAGALPDWRVELARLEPLADLTAAVIRGRYPDLAVPFHARWRHFVVRGQDLWAEMDARTDWTDRAERARAAFDLAITSVLLDAGAGMAWRYHDAATDSVSARSEGLAVASFRLFESGAFSGDVEPLQADALAELSTHTLAAGFQVSDVNPLVGLEGRAALLRRLGEQTLARPDLFGLKSAPRPGGLYDLLAGRAVDGRLPATAILEALLEGLGPIWSGRLTVMGLPMGDTWRHPAIIRPDSTDGLVPLHKLSQWLAYSLIEPLEAAGITVTDIDGLTGLAEYRNGGLFLDGGVLVAVDPVAAALPLEVSDPLVVGWRAMTVALLDEIAPMVRERLGVTAQAFPLACVLEGGTWAAGRRLAAERRADGGPPLAILSDGAVF
ncbi:URC4/urg3 family protein [Phenylobacterium aquaticum]|nr:URC4/urg3 family protein [Phenylobacterium aquaticum]